MTPAKKTESSDSGTSTTKSSESSAKAAKKEQPQVAGVAEALKFPTTADLNPAYVIPDE